uniref:CHK kinase-like domain-containing protein n=1 Tax=Panagrolaimus davidi TaxID=227884 RepID=A0A914QP37_9BILA
MPTTKAIEAAKEMMKEKGIDTKPDDKVIEGRLNMVIQIHNTECEFFQNLGPILDIPLPKIHKSIKWIMGGQKGIIHMEDLSNRSKTTSIFTKYSLAQVKNLMKYMVKWHKNAFVHRDAWQGKYTTGQNTFINMVRAFDPMIDGLFATFPDKMEPLKPFIEKYRKLFTNIDYWRYAMVGVQADIGLPPMLIHGDLHSGNLMWSIDDNDGITNQIAAIIDWQTIFEGNPMYDLAKLVTLCCDGPTRREIEYIIFDFYMEKITVEWKKNNNKEEMPFTKEKIKKAYNYAFILHAFSIIGIIACAPAFHNSYPENPAIREAELDLSFLSALHACQDADKLLQGEMKDVFEKYNL